MTSTAVDIKVATIEQKFPERERDEQVCLQIQFMFVVCLRLSHSQIANTRHQNLFLSLNPCLNL